MDQSSRSLGDAIRTARLAADFSLRDLTKRVSVTPSYLSDIENDRRVPSQEVLSAIAAVLQLDLDHLMALAGRLGDDAERFLKRHPTAGVLFRKISEHNLSEDALKTLVQETERLGQKGGNTK